MKETIYSEQSQVLAELFSGKGKILFVPLDFAKAEHAAQCCGLDGRYVWKHPLRVWNNARGVDYLLERITDICRKLRVKPSRVVIGGEDPGSFAMNFIAGIQRRGMKFVRVKAAKAAEYRKNNRASSDKLDLDGIAHAMIHHFAYDMAPAAGPYAELRLAARSRERATKRETALKSQIHQIVDRLLPGFLNDAKSGIPAFSPASLAILKEGITAKRLRRMREERLAAWLKKRGSLNSAEAAVKLRQLAAEMLEPDPTLAGHLQQVLRVKLRLLQALREEIALEENETARYLVQLPDALATSIPGLAINLVGGLAGEYGDPQRRPSIGQMFSYAGCAQRQKQTGGPGNPPAGQGLPRDCNHRIKNHLIHSAFMVGTFPHPADKAVGSEQAGNGHRLMQHWQAVAARGGHTHLSTARLLLRVIQAMVEQKRIYLPAWITRPQEDGPSPEIAAAWIEAATATMEAKWKKYDLDGIPDELNQIKQWRATADQEIKILTTKHS